MGSHDALFKHTFSVPEHAADVLRHALPPDVSRRIDWSSLRLEPGSFVDEALADRHTDLLFSAKLGERRVLLYLLFEHQSEPDPWMPLRLAVYITRIWEGSRSKGVTVSLPAVIPVVLHHGAAGWTAARSLDELVELDEETRVALGDRAMRLTITVEDLGRMPPAAIATAPARAIVRLVLGVLRDARSLSTEELFERWRDVIAEVAREAGRAALHVIVQYLSEVQRVDDIRELARSARLHAGPEMEDAVSTWMDKLRAEGKAEGKAEGRAEGKAEGEAGARADTLLKLITLKFGPPDAALVARVRGASVEEQDRLIARILTANSLDDLLG